MEVLQLICMLILKLFTCAHYVIMLHLISIVYVLLSDITTDDVLCALIAKIKKSKIVPLSSY